jgi:antitoxin ParD1/3/4
LSGRHQNAGEVLREGFRLVGQRDGEDRARLKALRDAAKTGIADIDAGRFERFASAKALRQHLDALVEDVLSNMPVGA